jgi:serine/threonine protein kinase
LDLAARTFAIKIITKKKFEGKPERERIQMMNEIQVQRRLKFCGNTLKLYKIYESDKYLNLLMEFQEGGTLGDKLEKGTVFTEEESKIIMA